ncbi:hypothetical protein [Flavobacterium sp.]|uniref:hypothetical protein n=1 Tax=Flavobacterium sp. TaxID=239 RepID=UPI00391BD667
MKTKTLLLIAFLVINVLSAQKNNFSKNVLGQWKISEKSTESYFTDILENYKKLDKASASQFESQKELLVKNFIPEIRYQFNEDFSLSIITPQGVQKGTWQISSDQKELSLISIRTTKYKIEIFSTSSFTITTEFGKNITFEKIKATESKANTNIESNDIEISESKNEIQNLINEFKSAIKNKDSVALTNLFYNKKVLWISVAHDKSFEYGKKLDPKVKEIEQSGAYELLNDPQLKDIGLEEKFYNINIFTDDKLATVVFDYKFVMESTTTNWGTESWQLVKTNKTWKIYNLMYTYNYLNIKPLPQYMID